MNSPHRFSVFGMRINSDLLLPELPIGRHAADESTVVIQAGEHRLWPAFDPSPHSTPSLQLGPQEWRLGLEGIGWFRATHGQRLEWQRWDDSVSDRDIRTFLVSSGLGALAIQRGELVVHGTALERNGEAILLLGHPATGKSTLAYGLLQRGWRLLSSELTVISLDGVVLAGLHQLKLWHDTAVELKLHWHDLPPVRRGLKRYFLLPPAIACATEPTPLRCIYALRRSISAPDFNDRSEPQDHQSSWASNPLPQQSGLLILRNQAFHARFYRGMNAEAQLFFAASSCTRAVTIRMLNVPMGVRQMDLSLNHIDLIDPDSRLHCDDHKKGTAGNE